MFTKHNEQITGLVINRSANTQTEAKDELLRIREKLSDFEPKSFYYVQSLNPAMELDDIFEGLDGLKRGDYIIALHKVDNFFAISDFNCPAIYRSVMKLLSEVG